MHHSWKRLYHKLVLHQYFNRKQNKVHFVKDSNYFFLFFLHVRLQVQLYFMILEQLGKDVEALEVIRGPLGGRWMFIVNSCWWRSEIWSQSKENVLWYRLKGDSPTHLVLFAFTFCFFESRLYFVIKVMWMTIIAPIGHKWRRQDGAQTQKTRWKAYLGFFTLMQHCSKDSSNPFSIFFDKHGEHGFLWESFSSR